MGPAQTKSATVLIPWALTWNIILLSLLFRTFCSLQLVSRLLLLQTVSLERYLPSCSNSRFLGLPSTWNQGGLQRCHQGHHQNLQRCCPPHLHHHHGKTGQHHHSWRSSESHERAS